METNSSEAIVAPAQAGKKSLLINRNFGLLAIGQGISQFGDFVFMFTITVWIVAQVAVGQSWAPLATSAIMFFGYVPYFIVGPWAGVFVDRWQHRRTMIIMDGLRALLIFLLILGTGTLPLPWKLPPFLLISLVCLQALLASICSQFFNPASTGLIGQIVAREDLPQAEGLSQTINASAKLLGPLLGPVLYLTFGIFWGLLINALSFIVSLSTVYIIHVPQQEESARETAQTSFWGEFKEGLSFTIRDRVIRTLIFSVIIVTLGTGALDALIVFFLQRNLHVNLSFFGVFVAAIGMGAIVGGIASGKLANRIGLKRMLYGSLLISGILLCILSRLDNFLVALLITLGVGISVAALNVALGALMIGETPKNLIGRVSAVANSLAMFSTTLSIVLGGYLASVVLVSLNWLVLGTTFHAIDTIYMGTGLLFIVSGMYILFALRGVTLKTSAPTEPDQEVEVSA